MSDDEVGLGNDNRYKGYIGAMERILRQYESTNEWADFIPYLARIKKVRFQMEILTLRKSDSILSLCSFSKTIESYSQYQCIPKRITLCKHLAQCLHPALPSGVHLKTLEVYEAIFRIEIFSNIR